MSASSWRMAASMVCIAFSGCAVTPDYRPPAIDTPMHWSEAPTSNASSAGSDVAWWAVFQDRELDSLIKRAMDSSLDVQLAKVRVQQARAEVGAASASLWPSVNVTTSYARERESQNAPVAVLVTPAGQIEAPPGQPDNLFRAGFDANWELDLFGGRRRAIEAAQANAESAAYDRGAVILTLLAEVAHNYIDLRRIQQQLALVRATLAAQQEMLDLIRARYKGGLASDLDVARAEAQVRPLAAQIPIAENSYRKAVHRLGVLLGQSPGALTEELAEARPIPLGSLTIPLGLPSDLLRQRPDIRRAERQLAVATARFGVATADLYPRFFLTGSAGLASAASSNFFSGDSVLWKIGPSMTWPILRRGQVVATIQVRDAQQQAALIVYRQAILNGLEDVENSIVAYTREQERRAILADAVREHQRAVNLIRSRYLGGLADFRDVVDAQRLLLQIQADLAQGEAAVAISLVGLYKALGGGWNAALLQATPGSREQVVTCSAEHPEEELKCSMSQ